jgi:hypothetical protein
MIPGKSVRSTGKPDVMGIQPQKKRRLISFLRPFDTMSLGPEAVRIYCRISSNEDLDEVRLF